MSFFSRPVVADSVAWLLQHASGAAEKRVGNRARARLPEYAGRTETLEIPTLSGPAHATVYRPEPGTEVPAVHVNLHGGGYVIGLPVNDDPACRLLAAESGSVVINFDYLLAPQHRFPAPPQQVYEALKWVVENGKEHGWDGNRLTIGGQSAGGGLAAAAARLALEQKGPVISLQVLHYPPLDLTVPAGTKKSLIAKPVLRPWMGDVFDTAYVPDPALRTDRLVSPAGPSDTTDLTGIAPAVVIAAQNDILRDEAHRYSERLKRCGALIEYIEIAGVDHGYDVNDDERTRASYTLISGHIRRATQK